MNYVQKIQQKYQSQNIDKKCQQKCGYRHLPGFGFMFDIEPIYLFDIGPGLVWQGCNLLLTAYTEQVEGMLAPVILHSHDQITIYQWVNQCFRVSSPLMAV